MREHPAGPVTHGMRQNRGVTALDSDIVPGSAQVGSDVDDPAAGLGPSWLDSWLAANAPRVVAIRRKIHACPELAGAEHATTGLVADELSRAGLHPRPLPGGTGLACDIGTGKRCVALRADLDALPLDEATGLAFASAVDGVTHACGHDAHTAALLGAGLALASAPALPGRVRLIFQPSEEVQPGGALDVLAAGELTGVDSVFALHCDPRLPVGQIGTRAGAITSATDLLTLHFTSAGGHTARPHLTGDLVAALGTVITGLPALLARRIDPRSGTVLVWGAAHAGHAANAIPRQGTLRGTVRTGDLDTWAGLEPLVVELLESLLAPTRVGHELNYVRGVPPVVNHPASTAQLQHAVRDGLGDAALVDTEQSSGGEDFGWYLERVPGAMARLGVWRGRGPQCDLHQPTFDLDERALALGVRVLVHAALAALT